MLELVAPAADRGLLTIEELRSAAGVANSADDVALLALGRRISDLIAQECGVAAAGISPPTLIEETVRETVYARGAALLRLSRRFISQVVAATVEGVAVDPASVQLDAAAGLLAAPSLASGCWRGRIVVTYKAGFPKASVPDALKHAAALAVREMRSAEARDPLLRSETIDGVGRWDFQVGGSVRDGSSALPAAAGAAIAPFMTVHVA